jgi:4-diphosphocytidyl-2-C-methyl-D-erythritol kinase
MAITLESPCKVNLLLNILGKRPDGFHELETILHPVRLCDELEIQARGVGVEVICDNPDLPVDGSNLVTRAATAFFDASGLSAGARIHLRKRVPMAAGLGGGSANAALTLQGLNRLFDQVLGPDKLQALAANLGSDVPFFLQSGPALGTGRGERIQPLGAFPCLDSAWILLVRPPFGVATAWAYAHLAQFPRALAGRPGRASEFARKLQSSTLAAASSGFYNSLEAPVFDKFPWLGVLKEFLMEQGAVAALMSGSGSCSFALCATRTIAETLQERVAERFGAANWMRIAPLRASADS